MRRVATGLDLVELDGGDGGGIEPLTAGAAALDTDADFSRRDRAMVEVLHKQIRQVGVFVGSFAIKVAVVQGRKVGCGRRVRGQQGLFWATANGRHCWGDQPEHSSAI